jgi:trehalose synthase-fused probable maltokinase
MVSAITAADMVGFLGGAGKAALTEFLSRQRWFAAKSRGIRVLEIADWASLRRCPPLVLMLVNVDEDRYYVPLSAPSVAPDDPRRRIAQFQGHTICDAHWDPDFGRLLLEAIMSGANLAASSGRFLCRPMEASSGRLATDIGGLRVQPLEGEQSNTSLRFDRALFLKSFRRPQTGVNPDLEITHFLTSRTSFASAAPLMGWVDYQERDGRSATVSILQRFVDNQGDGWQYTLASLRALCEALEPGGEASSRPSAMAERALCRSAGDLMEQMRALGTVTGALHAALASDSSLPDFRPEPITRGDIARWREEIARGCELLSADVLVARSRVPAAAEPTLATLDGLSDRIGPMLDNLALLADGQTCKIRCHGDYHLGQVLKTPEAFLVIDFEGEPARPLPDRRRKHATLRDVAGMLRSFNYAVHAVARERATEGPAPLLEWLGRWEDAARRRFLDGYVTAVSKSAVRLVPTTAAALAQACAVFELEKACYEFRYELNNRPDWIAIPLAGISRLLTSE